MDAVYGETRIGPGDISVAAQKVPIGRVQAIAKEIWAEISRSGVAANDDAGNDRLFKELQARYRDFAVSYPIPFQWMVQAREFRPRVFETFLRNHVKVMYDDRREFLAAQAEYLVLLFRARNSRSGPRCIARYRETVRSALEKDDEAFTEACEEAKAAVKSLDAENDAARRQRLGRYFSRLKAERETAARSASLDAGRAVRFVPADPSAPNRPVPAGDKASEVDVRGNGRRFKHGRLRPDATAV